VIPPKNYDLRHWRTPSRFALIARDILSAAAVAAVILFSSFAAGVLEQILRRLFK
jgi:hypothetical protein